ncbi:MULTISPECIES: GatB/YqeY domain-containing protein [Cohaesibacter]|uniref:GatB/YqeY domain-containing protein n=1 Tax=Cohaesibacter TaxID=655352 RepID=UPI000DE8DF3B|nr:MULTISPECIES: GatB/YqeY domain-containing protein [Cohaesibacter]TLP48363.1 GatB/YqeY domain-containing protein [Cohaesibacter sp. CAU 1516]
MREQISEHLKEAIKAQDKRRIATLRLISAAIKDRDVEARGQGKERVSDDELLQILAKMVKQRDESIAIYEEAGRLELAEQEREEAVIIKEFLPQQMSEDEVAATCSRAVEELDAGGLRDMGKVMAHLKAHYPGQMDFGKASCIVKGMLL